MGKQAALDLSALSDTDVTKLFRLPGADLQFLPIATAPPSPQA
jgi:hypothetical protein